MKVDRCRRSFLGVSGSKVILCRSETGEREFSACVCTGSTSKTRLRNSLNTTDCLAPVHEQAPAFQIPGPSQFDGDVPHRLSTLVHDAPRDQASGCHFNFQIFELLVGRKRYRPSRHGWNALSKLCRQVLREVDCDELENLAGADAVSYTHLTLPTSDLV